MTQNLAMLERTFVVARTHAPVVEALEDIGSQAGTCAARNRVAQHEALQAVAVVGLAVNDVKQLLVQALALGKWQAQDGGVSLHQPSGRRLLFLCCAKLLTAA